MRWGGRSLARSSASRRLAGCEREPAETACEAEQRRSDQDPAWTCRFGEAELSAPCSVIGPDICLVVAEVVLVEILESEDLLGDDTAVVLDHQSGQFRSVDQNEADVDPVGEVPGVRSEPAGGDEDPAAGLRAL